MGFDAKLFQSTLAQGLQDWELTLSNSQLEAMVEFAQLIVETNRTLNLTRILEPQEMAVKNFLDSLSILKLDWTENLQVLDLGTGAGFPGVPLAIARPSWSLVLLDSLRKRLNFLEEAATALGLENVSTLHARAEDAGQAKEHRETYDLVVSRAVAHLPVLLELCLPLVKVGGYFVAYKSSEAESELEKSSKALKELQGKLEQVFPLELPLQMGERNLLVFRKIAATPPTYPRRAGIPNKKPLE